MTGCGKGQYFFQFFAVGIIFGYPFRRGHGQRGKIDEHVCEVLRSAERRTVIELEPATARRQIPPHGKLTPRLVGQCVKFAPFARGTFFAEGTIEQVHDLNVPRGEHKGVFSCERLLLGKIQFFGQGVIPAARRDGGDGAGVGEVAARARKEFFAPFFRAQDAVGSLGVYAVERTYILFDNLQFSVAHKGGQVQKPLPRAAGKLIGVAVLVIFGFENIYIRLYPREVRANDRKFFGLFLGHGCGKRERSGRIFVPCVPVLCPLFPHRGEKVAAEGVQKRLGRKARPLQGNLHAHVEGHAVRLFERVFQFRRRQRAVFSRLQ